MFRGLKERGRERKRESEGEREEEREREREGVRETGERKKKRRRRSRKAAIDDGSSRLQDVFLSVIAFCRLSTNAPRAPSPEEG